MKLFLAAEAKHPDSMVKLESFIGGFRDKKIVYVPTAANGEKVEGYHWSKGETYQLFKDSGAKISVLELENYLTNDFKKDLINTDAIYFAGGYAAYLMYWVLRTKFDVVIKELVEKGVIYIGSSAGSMITGANLSVVEWFIGEEEPGAKYLPGLGLVDFDFYPHYEDSLYPQIKEKYTGKKLYLVKNGEAITVDGSEVTVLGEERIISK